MTRTKKYRLSDLERQILNMLAEAGGDELTVVLNTLDPGSGPLSPYINEFEGAVRRLCLLDKIVLGFSAPGDPRIPDTQRANCLNLRQWLSWEPHGEYWSGKPTWATHPIALLAA